MDEVEELIMRLKIGLQDHLEAFKDSSEFQQFLHIRGMYFGIEKSVQIAIQYLQELKKNEEN